MPIGVLVNRVCPGTALFRSLFASGLVAVKGSVRAGPFGRLSHDVLYRRHYYLNGVPVGVLARIPLGDPTRDTIRRTQGSDISRRES